MKNFLDLEKILNQLKLKENMTAADFGSGSGGWVILLAKKLEDGKVYAVDILEEPLSALKSKLKSENIDNVQTVLANVEKGTKIQEETCNLVLMTNLLFQCEDKKEVFKEAKRVLRPEGKILVVDWEKDSVLGPKEGRVLPEEIKKTAEEVGFKTEKEFKAGPYHWALILVK